MTFMTALVLLIALGALMSGSGEDGLFGGGKRYVAKEDNFTLLAGRVQTLDVLLNDENVDMVDRTTLRIAQAPECGYALVLGDGIQFSDSLGCNGTLRFSYCIPEGDACEPTGINLTVMKADEELQRLAAQDMVIKIVTPDAPGVGESSGGLVAMASDTNVAPERSQQAAQLSQTPTAPPSGTANVAVADRNSARPTVGRSAADPSAGFGAGVGAVGTETALARPAAPRVPGNRPARATSIAQMGAIPQPSGLNAPQIGGLTRPSASTVNIDDPSVATADAPQLIQLPSVDPVASNVMTADSGFAAPAATTADSDIVTIATPAPAPAAAPVRPSLETATIVPGAAPERPKNLPIRTQPVRQSRVEMNLGGLDPNAGQLNIDDEPTALPQIRTAAPAPQRSASPPMMALGGAGVAPDVRKPGPEAQYQLQQQARVTEPRENSGIMALFNRSSQLVGVTSTAATLELPTDLQPAAPVTRDLTESIRPKAAGVEITSTLMGVDAAARGESQIRLPGTVTAAPEARTASLGTTQLPGKAYQPKEGTARPLKDVLSGKTDTPALPGVDNSSVSVLVPGGASDESDSAPQVAALPRRNDAPLSGSVTDPASPLSCNVRLALSVRTGAEVVGSVTSPCRPNTKFDLSHAGLTYTVTTNSRGAVNFVMPAFTEVVDITATAADGGSATGSVTVKDLERFMRIGITWRGTADLDLNALEFGAEEDTDGHIRAENQRDYRRARQIGGGFLRVLGDQSEDGAKVEVYTIPQTSRLGSGLIELSVVVKDRADACNGNVVVQTVRSIGKNLTSDPDVSVALGECGSTQQIVVRNAVRDLQIARN